MQVKAQGLLNAAKWVETEYGRDALGRVVRACSEAVRDRYVTGIAINWHPVEEFIEFVDAADSMLGRGDGKIAEEIGAAGARANMKGTLVKAAFYLAQPEFFFKRITGLWHQFNDEGEMLLHDLADHEGHIEVTGLKTPNATFCAVLTGWTRQVGLGLGLHHPVARHIECRARSQARCIWEIRWTAIDDIPTAGIPSSGQIPSAKRFPSSGRMPAASVGKPPPSGDRAVPSSSPSRKLPPPKEGK